MARNAATALDGVRVLDLTSGPVGGTATAVLADFGADVIKVEPPGGDPLRRLTSSPLWLRGKRSIVLDLRDARSQSRLRGLAEQADVAVVPGPAERAVRLSADAERLWACNSALVHCSISGWGARGPYAHYPGYEGLVAAKSGRMLAFAGQIARPGPVYAAVRVASHAAAQGAVQTSLLQGLLPYDLAGLLLVQLAAHGVPGLIDPSAMGDGMPTLNYHPVQAADGRWLQLGNLLEHLFYAFLEATDLLSEMLADERFQGSPARWTREATEAARDRILTRLQERSAEEWMEVFRANGNVAAEPWLSCQDALAHPDLLANGDVIEIEQPGLGPVRQIGPIARLCATPARVSRPSRGWSRHGSDRPR